MHGQPHIRAKFYLCFWILSHDVTLYCSRFVYHVRWGIYYLYVEDLTLNIGNIFIKKTPINDLKIDNTLYHRSFDFHSNWFLWADKLHISFFVFYTRFLFLVIGILSCIILYLLITLDYWKKNLPSCSPTRLPYHTFVEFRGCIFSTMCIAVITYV